MMAFLVGSLVAPLPDLPAQTTPRGETAIGNTVVFASIPAPGYPEGIAVDGNTVYVGGPANFPGITLGMSGADSRIWRFDLSTGEPQAPLLMTGIETDNWGLANLAADDQGRIYVAAIEPGLGVLRVDPENGSIEPYATVPDLAPCDPLDPYPAACSPTRTDRPPLLNDLAFDADGNLYVADTFQATLWRIPPGGAAHAWFQHAALDQNFGANGIRIGPDGTQIYFAITGSDLNPTYAAGIYRLPLVAQPAGSDLELFSAVDSGDGIAFGASGILYVVAKIPNQIVALNPDGSEAYRFPEPIENLQMEVPYDAPATLAFHDAHRSILVTNHAIFDGAAFPQHFAVLEAFVDDTGLPLERPTIP